MGRVPVSILSCWHVVPVCAMIEINTGECNVSTVSFGKRERVRFRAEGSLGQWKPATGPALYAITYKQDPATRPKAHTVLFFGESENLADEAARIDQDFGQWRNQYSHDAELFVFSCPMPGSTKFERSRIASSLVLEYDPKANN